MAKTRKTHTFDVDDNITHELLHFSDLFLLKHFGGRVVVAREWKELQAYIGDKNESI